MEHMFSDAESFNQPIGSWSVNKVTSMVAMFGGAKSFNQPLGDWSVSKVTDMDDMFRSAESFNDKTLYRWDVSNCESMFFMFYRAEAFEGPVRTWNVEKVKNMGYMFNGATSFRDNSLCDWGDSLAAGTKVAHMFGDATSCESQDDPNLAASPPGPFCKVCYFNGIL